MPSVSRGVGSARYSAIGTMFWGRIEKGVSMQDGLLRGRLDDATANFLEVFGRVRLAGRAPQESIGDWSVCGLARWDVTSDAGRAPKNQSATPTPKAIYLARVGASV